MPILSGENPDGWLFCVERYFKINGLTERQKIWAIGVSLDRDALAWLQWIETKTLFHSWEQFRQLLLMRFQSI